MGGLHFVDLFQITKNLAYIINYMKTVLIFDVSGYSITLWDLYTKSTILVAFFNSIVTQFLYFEGAIDKEDRDEWKTLQADLEGDDDD